MNYIETARKKLQQRCFVFDRQYVIEDAIEYYERGIKELQHMKVNILELLPIYDELLECYENVKKFYDMGKTNEFLASITNDKNYYVQACNSYGKSGYFHKVHDVRMQLSKVYELEENWDLAIEQCQEALYASRMSSRKISIVKMYEQFVNLYLKADYYIKAIDMYAKLIDESNNTTLLKWSIPKYIQRRLLLIFAINGSEKTKLELDNYKDKYLIHEISTEYKLINEMLNTNSLEELQKVVMKYHTLAKLDEMDFKILVKIKENYYGLFDYNSNSDGEADWV